MNDRTLRGEGQGQLKEARKRKKNKEDEEKMETEPEEREERSEIKRLQKEQQILRCNTHILSTCLCVYICIYE